MTAAPGHNSTENGTVPPPDPPDPQPVPDAYRCGDLTDGGWEVLGYLGGWVSPSTFLPDTIRPARRKQAPPLTPREGDTVRTPYSHLSRVVYVDDGQAVTKKDEASALVVWDLWNLTVTDRPPERPVRVWLTDEQVDEWADDDAPVGTSALYVLADACRALVDEG